MALVERAIQQTAAWLGVDISEIDWITEESLESAIFLAEEGGGISDADEAPAVAPLLTCLPFDQGGARWPVQFTGQYCYGKKVWIWSHHSSVYKGYNLIIAGTRMYWKQATG